MLSCPCSLSELLATHQISAIITTMYGRDFKNPGGCQQQQEAWSYHLSRQ